MKTGPVVVWDAGRADDDCRKAEEQADVAGTNEETMFPERDERMPLRQTQLHRVTDDAVSCLLLLLLLLLLAGGGRRRDLERECGMTARVELRVDVRR